MQRIEKLLKINGIKKSMFLSAAYKPIGVLISYIYTPLMLTYLNEELYGVWITIISVTTWINYFDVGIGNGMRNIVASEVANGQVKKVKKIVSTAYFAVSVISLFTFILSLILMIFFNFDYFISKNISIKTPIVITVGFVCINFILSLCKSEFFAEQKAEVVSFMQIGTSLLNLVGIFFISRIFSPNLTLVALLTGISTTIVNVCFSYKLWSKKNYYMPSIKAIDIRSMKNIANLGVKFFILQIGCFILYSTDNIIITRLFSAAEVVPYNTAYKVFNLIQIMFAAFISPIWSKITVISTQHDYIGIKILLKKLNILMIPISMIILFFIVGFRDISYIWLRRELVYAPGLILCVGIFIFLNIYSSIYSAVLNGMGILNLQLYVSVFISIINIPLSIYFCTHYKFGVTGVILATIICMLISVISLVIQTIYVLKKLIRKNN